MLKKVAAYDIAKTKKSRYFIKHKAPHEEVLSP